MKLYPRYAIFIICCLTTIFATVFAIAFSNVWWAALSVVTAALTVLGILDLRQKKHSILRNYPVIGNLRFVLEYIRPEIRQYFIESDTDAAPFSRASRTTSW